MPYYFNLPPSTALTRDQQMAVNETGPISISGGPGTGKTIVSLWRHIFNYEGANVRSLLLTYTKTLEHYLRQSAETRSERASEAIDRTYRWTYGRNQRNYDEIIVDEAQDVEINRYEIINNHCDQCSYGADDAQSVYPDKGCTNSQLKQIFPDNEEYPLEQNFRNSREILLFTKSIFPQILISQGTINSATESGIRPMVQVLGWEIEDMVDSILEIVEEYSADTHNIGILLPSAKQVNEFFNLLEDEINCSKYEGEMSDFETLENIHITTYKSAKGAEFDTVIIPNFDSFEWFIDNTENIGQSDYYVALTRTRRNLFLLCKNDLDIFDDTYDTE